MPTANTATPDPAQMPFAQSRSLPPKRVTAGGVRFEDEYRHLIATS